jgi:iron(III) transport system ATP-binding protein
MTTTDLSARDITKHYDGTVVVDQVSLKLQPGKITALLGGSGAGKSTLLRLFAGLETPDAGEIWMGDTCLSTTKRSVAPEKRRIGLIFQDFALFPHMTASENVRFGLNKMAKGDAELAAADWLDRLNLTGRAKAYPHELSGGEQQRVAIARALAPQPLAILMDEPFSGLDPALRDSVRDIAIRAIKDANIPALLVTHDAAEALGTADDIAIMKGGKILQNGPSESVYMTPNSVDVASALGAANSIAATDLPASLTADLKTDGAQLVIRPEGVLIDKTAVTAATVQARHLIGPVVRLSLQVGDQYLSAFAPRANAPSVGDQVRIRLDPEMVFIFASDAI